MKTSLRTLSVALAAALVSPSVLAIEKIDFHGYMRAGVGVSRMVGLPNGKKRWWAVWVTNPIPMAR
ncbi:maltoporin [Yersinia pseudotuberculosis]|nr:maltoporin [Yersinia pseudotuberculosis]SUP88251.1 maltoporin [Yersinia pseudotuberculosis]